MGTIDITAFHVTIAFVAIVLERDCKAGIITKYLVNKLYMKIAPLKFLRITKHVNNRPTIMKLSITSNLLHTSTYITYSAIFDHTLVYKCKKFEFNELFIFSSTYN